MGERLTRKIYEAEWEEQVQQAEKKRGIKWREVRKLAQGKNIWMSIICGEIVDLNPIHNGKVDF